MIRYIAKRILMMIPVLLGVILVVFIMNHISDGDPARMLAGENASEEAVEAIREELGLNDPLPVQFFNYVKGIVTEFDLQLKGAIRTLEKKKGIHAQVNEMREKEF